MSVIVSHVAFSVAAALIQVSQVQFDPLASTADVRVSWVQFDPVAATSQPVASPASGSGASRRAFGRHQGITAPQVFEVPKVMVDRSEEEILAIILAEAARIYYT